MRKFHIGDDFILQCDTTIYIKQTADSYLILDHDDKIVEYGGELSYTLKNFINKSFTDIREHLMLQHVKENQYNCSSNHSNYSCYIIQIDEGTILSFIRQDDLQIQFFQQIFNKLTDGILVSNKDGKIIYYNKALEKMESMKAEEVVNKYLWDVYQINPETSEHKRVRETQVPIVDQYKAHAYSNGSPQYLTYSTYPLMLNDQSIGAFSICMNDTILKNLLHETLELKRDLYSLDSNFEKKPSNGTIYSFEDIKGQDSQYIECIREAQTIALYNTDILIIGESGTGKELFAQSIHNYSSRAEHPFIAVNCAAIPENLLESTLFGTVKGAFTGATDQAGLFEYAGHGTLFLDEINSMPLSLQAKIIRVLEERQVRRVGSNKNYSIHCNIISASNEDPQKLIQENKLRLDLYYRIAKASIYIPSLTERKSDIAYYTDYFIKQNNEKYNKQITSVSPAVKNIFFSYRWPGNTRELQHLVDNMCIRASFNQSMLSESHIPIHLLKNMHPPKDSIGIPITSKSIKDYTPHELSELLNETHWNIAKAARTLNVSRQNLQYHLKKHQISKNQSFT